MEAQARHPHRHTRLDRRSSNHPLGRGARNPFATPASHSLPTCLRPCARGKASAARNAAFPGDPDRLSRCPHRFRLLHLPYH